MFNQYQPMFNQYLWNLTNVNGYLTNTENLLYKVSVISVKYWLSIGLYWLYWLNIGLLKFVP